MLRLLTGGFEQSVRMCLDTLGFADAEIRTSHELAVATAPIDSPAGVIEPGQVAPSSSPGRRSSARRRSSGSR